ncbi:hypothetical protein PIROE2DRAFT_5889, partial [Piromyces sp. E2]
MVVKPINYVSPLFSSEPTFYLGMYAIPKTSCYIYLGIPFTDDLLIDHIVQYMFSKVKNKAIYFSPLLGSNKHRTARIHTLINTGLFWCIGSYTHKKSSGNSHNKSEYLRHSPTMSTYAISRDLEIPPIVGTCAAFQ